MSGEGLNPQQQAAVTAGPVNMAVIAGAGSGKTKVLTSRVAHLLSSNAWDPERILAVTFTNKAAAEMKHRLQAVGIQNVDAMWVGTFHGLCCRMLRRHAALVGLPQAFQIIDAAEQLALAKKITKDMQADPERFDPKEAITYINACKDAGVRAALAKAATPEQVHFRELYTRYQDHCDKQGLLDFGELLLRAFELLQNEPILLKSYRQRFGHILVDEFQDTNDVQYAWVALLSDTGAAIPVTVVGDMDQSIYSWRGARMANVQRFVSDFPNVSIVKLEQNYRSTAPILACANALIGNNRARIPKALWTDQTGGDPVLLFEAGTEREEAEYAIDRAIETRARTGRWCDTAVLYRSNAQSRILEEVCIRRRLPYHIHGGLRFFERAEIKDAMAHLNMMVNPGNDLAFERAIKTPSRGFGDKALAAIREAATRSGSSLHAAASHLRHPPRLASSWQNLAALWQAPGKSLTDMVTACVRDSGLLEHYQALDRKEGTERAGNLQELISVASRFPGSAGRQSIIDFLDAAALEAGQTEDRDTDAIQFMTVHSAKGLEFACVVAVGWDDGLFPSARSSAERDSLEEERRLAYVAITRARQRLFITGAVSRRQYGQVLSLPQSRFIDELPADQARWASRPTRAQAARPVLSESGDQTGLAPPAQNPAAHWRVGQKVVHPQHGEGRIMRVDGNKSSDRVLVAFARGAPQLMDPIRERLRSAG